MMNYQTCNIHKKGMCGLGLLPQVKSIDQVSSFNYEWKRPFDFAKHHHTYNIDVSEITGSNSSLEKSQFLEKENKSKATKKKKSSNKFTSLGKDQTVSILHGVGRVLNPKGNFLSNKILHLNIRICLPSFC